MSGFHSEEASALSCLIPWCKLRMTETDREDGSASDIRFGVTH